MKKKKVAFICVHNSCRSQIAEALGKHLAGDVFESYSAGTETKPQMNQDAIRLMKEIYGIDKAVNLFQKFQRLIWQFPWAAMLAARLLGEDLMITGVLKIQQENQMKNLRL